MCICVQEGRVKGVVTICIIKCSELMQRSTEPLLQCAADKCKDVTSTSIAGYKLKTVAGFKDRGKGENQAPMFPLHAELISTLE